METQTPIRIEDKIRVKLIKMKYDLGLSSISEVIEKLLKLVTTFKLASELKEVSKK